MYGALPVTIIIVYIKIYNYINPVIILGMSVSASTGTCKFTATFSTTDVVDFILPYTENKHDTSERILKVPLILNKNK